MLPRLPDLRLCCPAVIAVSIGAVPAACQFTEGNALPVIPGVDAYVEEARADPFRPRIQAEAPTIELEELVLLGTIGRPESARSVALFALRTTDRRIRASVGQQIGEMRVVAVGEGSAEVTIEGTGPVRGRTLTLRRSGAADNAEVR